MVCAWKMDGNVCHRVSVSPPRPPHPPPPHSWQSQFTAISISIPNSKQLPIVYLFLQLVVDFPSGPMVMVVPPILQFS